MQEGIRGKGIAHCLSALGIELNEVEGDLLDPRLGLLFEGFPCRTAQLIELRGCPILAIVFANLMQGVNAYIEHISVPIDELNGLLLLAIYIYFL